jgi:hypothetical protein
MADYRRIEFSGQFEEMPPFLEWFPVPVSRAFAKSVLKVKSPKTDKHYGDDEYRIDRGNVFYSHREAYELPWTEVVEKVDFALQVEAAETGKAESPIRLALYRRDKDTGRLARERAIETTQRRLVDFLWSGRLSEL